MSATKIVLDRQATAQTFPFGTTAATGQGLLTINNGTAATSNVVLDCKGSANIGGDLNLIGNLNITGSINEQSVTNLLVTDFTVTLNNGGTTPTDDTAGVRMQGTSASLIGAIYYKAASATKWSVGDGTTQQDVVGISANQTLTNKTLTSPTLTTPVLGTPASGTLTNCTGYATSALAGLGTGVATFLATPSSANLFSAVTGSTGTGALVFGSTPTLATPVINGLPTGTGVASGPTISTLVSRDVNGNGSFVNALEGYSTTVTAAGTTTLTVSSTYNQFFTGVTTQILALPVVTTLVNGQSFVVVNNSTGLVTIQTSGAVPLLILGSGTSASIVCKDITGGTGVASWNSSYLGSNVASGKVLISSNTLTLSGTDNTIMTFPSTSATIARTDVAQTFIGHNTFEGVTPTGATGSGNMVFNSAPTLINPVLGAAAGTSLVLSSKIDEAKGADIASAATTNIGAATGNYVNITGVTAITAFDSVQAGIRRVLNFNSALVLTYNAVSLILPSSANITTIGGDTATFVSLGAGNWICVQYQRRDGTALNTGASAFQRSTAVSGTQDGTNKIFAVANSIATGSEQVFINGQLLMPGASNDYVISGTSVTFQAAFTAPASTDVLRVYGTY